MFIDLRDCELTEHDEVLAGASDVKTLTSVDVRGNPGLKGKGRGAHPCNERRKSSMALRGPGHPRSLCGVSPSNTRLEVPRTFTGESAEVDIMLTVAWSATCSQSRSQPAWAARQLVT